MFLLKTDDKRDDFDFDIVNFPFLDGDVPRATSYGMIGCLVMSLTLKQDKHILTAKLLKHVYRHHKLLKTFSKFYRCHYDLVSKFNTGLKSLEQGLSEPEFYDDLVYKLRNIIGRNDFRSDSI